MRGLFTDENHIVPKVFVPVMASVICVCYLCSSAQSDICSLHGARVAVRCVTAVFTFCFSHTTWANFMLENSRVF